VVYFHSRCRQKIFSRYNLSQKQRNTRIFNLTEKVNKMDITKRNILDSISYSKKILSNTDLLLADIANDLYNGDKSLVTSKDIHDAKNNLHQYIIYDMDVLDKFYQ